MTNALEETLLPLDLPGGHKVEGWREQGRLLSVLVSGESHNDEILAVVQEAVGDGFRVSIYRRPATKAEKLESVRRFQKAGRTGIRL